MMPFLDSPWQTVRLNEVCEPKESFDPRRDSTAEFKYVDISCISNKRFEIESWHRMRGADAPSRARKRIRTDDVIVATTRPYLRSIARVPEELEGEICSTGFCVLRSGREVIPDWMFYSVLSPEFIGQLTEQMRGANYPQVSDRDVLGSVIPLPPIAEQYRIVRRIDECMERIDEIRQLREEGVYESQAIESAVFHDLLHDGRGVPRWQFVRLGDLTTSSKYGVSSRAQLEPTGVPIVRMGNIVGGYLDFSDLKYVELPDEKKRKYLLCPGDVLINRTNSLELVGKAATFDRDEGDWVYASYLVRIQVDRNRVLPEYVTATINSRIGRNYVLSTARRAIGMVNINAKEMAGFPISLPPLDIQRKFVDRLAEVRRVSQQVRKGLSAANADQLSNAVLRKAFSGEL